MPRANPENRRASRSISRPPLTNEQFIRIWMEAKTCRDMAMRTGLRMTHVYSRARKLRKRGVNLPPHVYTVPNRGPKPFDAAKLNRLVERLREKNGSDEVA